jgi:hypothetical protein
VGALLVVLCCSVACVANSTPNHAKPEAVSGHGDNPRRLLAASHDGWNASRAADNETRSANLFLAQYGPEGTARAARESLLEAARPDLRIFLAIGAIILLLRVLRNREQMRVETQATSNAASGNQLSTSAAQDVKELRAA